jgi:hypothetical protein
MGHVPGPPPFRIGHGRNAGDLNAWPAEQHGEGTGIVGVPAQIRVEVNTHRAMMLLTSGGRLVHAAAALIRLRGVSGSSRSLGLPRSASTQCEVMIGS